MVTSDYEENLNQFKNLPFIKQLLLEQIKIYSYGLASTIFNTLTLKYISLLLFYQC